jgi:hypothetical protein
MNVSGFRLLLSFSFDLKHSVKHPFIISHYEKHKEKRTGSLSTFIEEKKKKCSMQDICLHLVNQQEKKKKGKKRKHTQEPM